MPEPPPWPAPAAAGPLAGRVEIPGSKSLTNRSLLLAALADGPSRITGGLRARDTDLMISGLRALGVEVDVGAGGRKGGAGGKGGAAGKGGAGSKGGAAGKGGAGSKDRDRREDRDRGADKGGSGRPGDEDWTVTPGALAGPAHVDCGLAGTVMRFLPVIAGLAKGDIRFDGDPRARLRPMGALLSALEQLGIRVDDDGRNSLPFTVRGAGMIPGGEATIDASASSQYVSALLLSGARFDEGLTLRHVGPALPSLPHIEMSVVMLGESGVTVSQDVSNPAAASWRVSPGPIAAVDRRIEPDLSNAAPFLAAAMVTGGEVSIPGWPQQTTQAGDHLRQIFTEMGADVTLDDDGLRLRGPASIGGIDIDLRDVGELTPVIAAVAALADSPSRLRGIGHLRGHETDRLEALATEINALGGSVKAKANSLRIRPGRLRGGVWQTYEDHRMVMAGAVLGLRVANLQIADVDTVRKTLPDFVQRWESMLSGSAS